MHRLLRSLVALLGLVFPLCASIAFAGPRDNPPPLDGWVHPPLGADDSPQRHGVILSGGPVVRSSPVIAEIASGSAGKEVAIGSVDGRLYVYRANGQLLWSKNVMPASCTVLSGDSKLSSAPAVGEIFGDGVPYVVVGYGAMSPSDCDGGVAVYRGSNGDLAWRFSLREWQASQGYRAENLYGVSSSPALADTDDDGDLEIGFGGLDRNIYLLNANGTPRWYYHAADTVLSSPAFANTDADAPLELVIGADISANSKINPPTSDGGYVYVFDTQPRSPLRIEFQTGFLWRTFFDQAIYSSPAIGDVLASNPGNEIVVGASCYFPTNTNNLGAKNGRWLKILRLSDGAVLQTLNADACIQSSPALGNLDNDDELEIVATVNTPSVPEGCNNNSSIKAWNATNPAPLWSRVTGDPNSGCNDPFGADLQSPVIADLDDNGSLEVAAANFWSVHILNGATGVPLTCQNLSCGSQTSLFAWGTLKSTPAIGDIDDDGQLDLVIGGIHINVNGGNTGLLYAWTGFAGLLNSPVGSQSPSSAPWPMFRANPAHTGVLMVPTLRATPPAVSRIVQQGGVAANYRVRVEELTGSSVAWNASADQPWITLDPNSGTTPDTLRITLDPTGLNIGTYTGTVTIDSSIGQRSIEVTLFVVDQVIATHIPLVMR